MFIINSGRKKRKLYEMNDISIDASGQDKNASIDSLAGSHCSMAVQSPWETRRMKADLIEARSRVNFQIRLSRMSFPK